MMTEPELQRLLTLGPCEEIDRAVAEVTGIKGEPRWICTNDGGKSMSAWTDRFDGPWFSKGELEHWLLDNQQRGYYLDCVIVSSPAIPGFSTDAAAALAALDKFRQRGWWAMIKSPFTHEDQWFVGLCPMGVTGWNGEPDFVACADSLALAICRVILRAAFEMGGSE